MIFYQPTLAALVFYLIALLVPARHRGTADQKDSVRYSRERHLANVRQLTFGGDNAEAYWSFSNRRLVFQSNNPAWGLACDQIFYTSLTDDLMTAAPRMLSTGKGRTTCAYFLPGDKTVLYASTHEGGDSCPAEPERRPGGKYLWPIYDTYDIYVANLKGKIIRRLTNTKGYDAEATVSPRGDRIVFTSTRNGDLDLYTMNIDGTDVKQITNIPGYDGGAFFSPDGSKIVFRASRPQTEQALKEYKELLLQGLVAPTEMEIFVCDADGSNLRQVTTLGKANWAPFYHPDGKRILFSSNHKGSRGFQFNIFMIHEDGSGLQQITYDPVFDSFPMFSYDGRKIVFSSNRNNGGTRNTNLFVADWVE